MISVILPVYNGQTTLKDSIESVLNQNYRDYEFIIIDDCSTDSSKHICNSYNKNPVVRLYTNESNLGLFKTLNKGVDLAQGSLIKLWAQDDIMKPDCLNDFHQAQMAFPKASFYWCHSTTIYSTTKSIDLDENNLNNRQQQCETWSREKVIRVFYYCGSLHGNISLIAFNRTLFTEEKIQFKHWVYSGDIEFTRQALKIGKPVLIRKELVWLRNHDKQLSKSIKHLHFETKETLETFRKLRNDFEDVLSINPELLTFIDDCYYQKTILYHLSSFRETFRHGEIRKSVIIMRSIIKATGVFPLVRYSIIPLITKKRKAIRL